MKKALVFITVFCLIMAMFADTTAAASYSTKPPLSIQILGKKVTPAPILYKDKVFVPLRATGQALGYQVLYSESKKTMDLVSKTFKVTVTVGYPYAKVNGSSVKLDIAPVLSNGSLYVPLTFVQKNFKYNTQFIADKNMVVINKLGSGSTTPSTPPASTQPAAATNSISVLGKKVNNQEKPILKNGVAYVPLRLVSESLGYTASWSWSNNTMTMTKTGSSVSVVAGKSTATVNKQTVKLDGIPFLTGGRIYAPMSMIGKNLGYVTYYDKAKNNVVIGNKTESKPEEPRTDLINIVNVDYDDNGGFSQINISADRPIISFNNFTLANPNRLVIDMNKTCLNLEDENVEINKDGIYKVRAGVLGPEAVRIVVDLQAQKTYRIVQSDDKKTISIIYANIISPVTYSKEGDFDVVTIKGSSANDASSMDIDNPRRIVVDIDGAVFDNLNQEITASSELLKGIRIGQYDIGTARVVLDVTDNAYYKVKTTGNVTKIYLSSYPFDFVEYKTYYNTGIVNLSPGSETQYTISTDSVNNVVNVVIPQDLKLESKRIDINDNLIKYIDIASQYQNGSKVTTASIKMQDSIESEVISPAASKLIKIRFKRKITSLDQLTIVVDAGHGGTDPGASALDGTKEKNYNLDVAMRLDRILKSLGFKTIMTRNTDTFIELGGRTDLANNNYADFFMSIHFNAYNKTANGIETLYYPNTTNEDYTLSNKQIADIFHNEIVGALGRASRGVTPRPNLYVLNKTKMPAILAELGFITNPDELSQIETEAYREKAARALAVSIVKYFRDIQGVNVDIDLNSIYTWPYPGQTVEQPAQSSTPDQTVVQPDPAAQTDTSQQPTQEPVQTQDATSPVQN